MKSTLPETRLRAACVDPALLGNRYSSGVGIAPTGLAGLTRRDAKSMLAHAARANDVPFILSGASIELLEAVASIDPAGPIANSSR